VLDIEAQEHDLWFDSSNVYTLNGFIDDMATKIIWGPGQQLLLWGVDTESETEWKVISNEQFEEMIMCRMDEKVMHISCDVVQKDVSPVHLAYNPSFLAYFFSQNSIFLSQQISQQCFSAGLSAQPNVSVAGLNDVIRRDKKGGGSSVGATSGVTNAGHGTHAEGVDDTCSSPEEGRVEGNIVDWSILTVIPDGDCDREALDVVNEDEIYEAFGFKQADEEQVDDIPIPNIPPEVQAKMEEAAIPINDNIDAEPVFVWDRDNPDMAVGTLYPCMNDFRMAVK
jgi:hypothetical protein